MSDDNQISETASDGADNSDELLTRAGSKKIIAQRDQLKAGFDDLQADYTRLEAKHAHLMATTKAKPDGEAKEEHAPAVPGVLGEFMAEIKAEMAGVKDMFSQHRAGEAKAAVLSEVLKQVPDGQHKTAEALLGTLGVDFTQPGAAADALAALRNDHPAVLVDHTRGSQPRAPQKLPDGSPNFKAWKSFDEVPDEFKPAAFADPDTMSRLRSNALGGDDDHCI